MELRYLYIKKEQKFICSFFMCRFTGAARKHGLLAKNRVKGMPSHNI
jgi:hypothetical protein